MSYDAVIEVPSDIVIKRIGQRYSHGWICVVVYFAPEKPIQQILHDAFVICLMQQRKLGLPDHFAVGRRYRRQGGEGLGSLHFEHKIIVAECEKLLAPG